MTEILAIAAAPEQPVVCIKCLRPVRSEASKARRYGNGCWRYVNRVANELEKLGYGPADRAAEALRDGAAVPTARRGVYLFVSSGGAETYLVHAKADNCAGGRRAGFCYHKITVSVLSGTWMQDKPSGKAIAL